MGSHDISASHLLLLESHRHGSCSPTHSTWDMSWNIVALPMCLSWKPTSWDLLLGSLPMGCHDVPALPMCFPWEPNAMGTAPPFTSHGMPRCSSASHVPPMDTQAMGTAPSGTSHKMPWLPSFSHERPMGSQLCLLCCAAPYLRRSAGLYSCAQARAVACAGLRRLFCFVLFSLRRLECTVESGKSSNAVLRLACWQHACMPTRIGVNAYERLIATVTWHSQMQTQSQGTTCQGACCPQPFDSALTRMKKMLS